MLRAGRWVALALLVIGWPGAVGAQARAPVAHPSFSTGPALHPSFSWQVRDYVVRCDQSPVRVQVDVPTGWRGQVGPTDPHSADFVVHRSLDAGSALVVSFHRAGKPSARTYFHLRCLPSDFPFYQFRRSAPGGPDFFVAQLNHGYAVIFNRQGVPMWWDQSGPQAIDAQVNPDGTVSWTTATGPALTGGFEIHRLDGSLVREVNTVGGPTTDIHDLQRLPNGNYLVGGQVIEHHVDTSAYGGSSNADIMGFEIQEVTPGGQLVWKWDSLDHIGLAQTPTTYWDQVVQQPQPYDIQHWNSLEPEGSNRLLLSFRNLDAVYEINRTTGNVIWKLGGTTTPKSLTVLNDPYASYPLGAQHDARRLPDGTISLHDNFTYQNRGPRAVRYRIDPQAGTATLVESVTDPDAAASQCCGSARKLPSGGWLIGWGRIPNAPPINRFIGGYNSSGQRIFELELPYGFFYRAFPVPSGEINADQLRHGMNAMAH
ncbi:MAG: arylsulfotransferase family protein [Solirubrobacterales bacterium]